MLVSRILAVLMYQVVMTLSASMSNLPYRICAKTAQLSLDHIIVSTTKDKCPIPTFALMSPHVRSVLEEAFVDADNYNIDKSGSHPFESITEIDMEDELNEEDDGVETLDENEDDFFGGRGLYQSLNNSTEV